MGDELEALCDIYVWPSDKRPRDNSGRYGSLHAKCAVADTASALISSANLTEYALNLNMELGLFVHGGDMPGRLVEHLKWLMDQKALVPIQRGSFNPTPGPHPEHS